jgi:hypothetical protein
VVEGVGIEPFPSVEVRKGRGNPYTPDDLRINLHNTPICDDEALGVTYQRLVKHGAMAQLVAHLHGMERVRGSNPLSSTFATAKATSTEVAFAFFISQTPYMR